MQVFATENAHARWTAYWRMYKCVVEFCSPFYKYAFQDGHVVETASYNILIISEKKNNVWFLWFFMDCVETRQHSVHGYERKQDKEKSLHHFYLGEAPNRSKRCKQIVWCATYEQLAVQCINYGRWSLDLGLCL